MQEYCQNQFLEFDTFKRTVDCIFEKHAPLKNAMLELTNKYIDKQIMKRRFTRNKFFNSKSDTNWEAYNKKKKRIDNGRVFGVC